MDSAPTPALAPALAPASATALPGPFPGARRRGPLACGPSRAPWRAQGQAAGAVRSSAAGLGPARCRAWRRRRSDPGLCRPPLSPRPSSRVRGPPRRHGYRASHRPSPLLCSPAHPPHETALAGPPMPHAREGDVTAPGARCAPGPDRGQPKPRARKPPTLDPWPVRALFLSHEQGCGRDPTPPHPGHPADPARAQWAVAVEESGARTEERGLRASY